MSEDRPSRREVIERLAALGAGAAALPGCVLGLGSSTEVAPVTAVPPGSAFRTSVKDQPIILVNVEGQIRAFSGICTHESCELGWNQRQQLIRCPCHGSGFAPDGTVAMGPATRALPEFPVSIREGKVLVEL